MGSSEDIFRNYISPEPLGEDFEDRVFRKIGKKKKQRAVAASAMGIFLLGGFLYISGTLFFPGKTAPLYTKGEMNTREEIPVTDYATFAASDETNKYIIEQVGYFENSGTI